MPSGFLTNRYVGVHTIYVATFGEWFKQERKRRGWSQKDIETRTGGQIPQGTVASWEVGEVRHPRVEAYPLVARLFGMAMEEVYAAVGLAPAVIQRETPRDLLQRAMIQLGESLPVYRFADYSTGEEARMHHATGQEVHIPAAVMGQHHRIEAYELEGDFPPAYTSGDIIIVDRDASIEDGDDVAFTCDGLPCIGRLRQIGGSLWLEGKRRCAFRDCADCALVLYKQVTVARRLQRKSP
jgi:transcriptional regulator with XRE-family HTH domain